MGTTFPPLPATNQQGRWCAPVKSHRVNGSRTGPDDATLVEQLELVAKPSRLAAILPKAPADSVPPFGELGTVSLVNHSQNRVAAARVRGAILCGIAVAINWDGANEIVQRLVAGMLHRGDVTDPLAAKNAPAAS